MYRFFSAVALCLLLLIAGLFIFLPYTRAADNPIIALLNLPAPPPPNPLVKSRSNNYVGNEAALKNAEPPTDEAPIEELMAFWTSQNSSYTGMDYLPPMSERTASRILSELEKKPEDVVNYLNVFPDSPEVVEKIKGFYDHGFAKTKGEEGEDYSPAEAIKVWLTNHSKYYSDELLKSAAQVHDDRQYVTNQDTLLALAHVDWDKAEPIVSRLYNDSSQPVSQTLARWVYYKHALETDSSGDVDKYRDELQKTVENKSAGAGMRDLAMDALVKEKDWKGRDDWYYSLLDDETLYDLRVNDQTYTGLTTLIRASKSGKYTPKMLELVSSGSPAVRGMAARNLAQFINADHPEIVTALLPWLENAKWAGDNDGSRRQIVEALATLQLPESVPGLLALLNEKPAPRNSVMSNSNRMIGNVVDAPVVEDYSPYRSSIIAALGKQKDARAIAPVRQILPELQDYERTAAVGTLLACGGFSTTEQVDALESVAKLQGATTPVAPMTNTMTANRATIIDREIITDDDDEDNSDQPTTPVITSEANISTPTFREEPPILVRREFTADELKRTLGQVVANNTEPEEPLVAATIDRINVLDRKDPQTANNMRTILQSWHGAAVNSFLLKDLKNGKIDSDAIVKLLSLRKELREKQSNDVYDVRNGTPTALGISTCLIENDNEYDAILSGENAEAKTAMLACARLIRAKLPVPRVAESLKSSDQLLAIAAESYLESEDSPAARNVVLSLYPNEAKILGATVYFSQNNADIGSNEFLSNLFSSLATSDSPAPTFYGYSNADSVYKIEKRLRKEVLTDPKLLGVYAYDSNFVRIYNDQVVYSWEEDDSRYRERTLEPAEFENLKNYLTSQNVNDLPPFLSDCEEECSSKELLMLGKQGGRRIFEHGADTPEFFGGLNQIFEQMRVPPARLRYRLEKDLAGLEILYADDNLKAQTVWKSAGDLRVLIDNQKLREQINSDLEKQERAEEETENFDSEAAEPMRRKRREQREYENYSWRKIVNNQLGEVAAQPPLIEYLPKRDNLAVAAQPEQWKRRTANFELRRDDTGIYKVTRGQIAKIRSGYYDKLLVTPDGRWAFATNYGDIPGLVRINLLTNKETPIQKIENFPAVEAVAVVPSLNKILVFSGYYNEGQTPERDGVYLLLDPETGAMQPAKGEVRPLAQQTFRPLQPTAKPDEFWAAIPDTEKNRTTFGIYNAKTLTFKPLLKIPKISFDSMNMWVDETEKKIYFVYEGHLLALPMAK